MESLYNKIYKAINEGIQKALLIDPDHNDVSINYLYHKIDNAVIDKNKFNRIAVEFIENPTVEKYNAVLAYSMNGVYQYTVNYFNELNNIFENISNITDNINLSWIDTQNVLTFITDNNWELSLNEIDDKKDITFIKFNNINNLNHPVIIHKDLLILDKESWSIKDEKLIQKRNKQMNGYENTKIIKNNYDLCEYPAFKYCIDLKNNLKLTDYDGYLPAIKELKFLNKNCNLINYILKYIKGAILNINSGDWWSSTQYSATGAWGLSNGSPYSYYKDYSWQVLPFFAKIN